jgi:hypothetical protein
MKEKSDREQYYENRFYNTKYLIRDVFSYFDLKELQEFLAETIKDYEIHQLEEKNKDEKRTK